MWRDVAGLNLKRTDEMGLNNSLFLMDLMDF